MAEFSPMADPVEQMRQRLVGIERTDEVLQANGGMDAQEEQERLAATEAYFGEDEAHFVNFAVEMIKHAATTNQDIRQIQQECWQVYQEDAPPNYALKEAWQSKVIVPKPYGAVQFGMAAVKQAFSPNFLSIEDKRHPKLAAFWRRLMETQLDREHGKFVTRFTMASGMGFAVGQSFELIPVWRPGRGLDFTAVEPWKINRDPDALPLDPWSGMFWSHEEFQDLWFLRQQEVLGRYTNTGTLSVGEEDQNPHNFHMDRTRTAELRRQLWQRNPYRQSILTREYWGTVLDKRGNLLHPSLVYTVAGNRAIGLPRPSPYPTLRWPGVSFSPLPNFLRYEGRSLLQSVRSLWYFMCNLQSLHIDNLNWVTNPMIEIEQQRLIDQDDIDPYPGREYLVRGSVNGQPAVRTVDRKFVTNEVLANKMSSDQDFQRGTFITDPIQGLPGFRQQITARESAQNLQQSLTVFSIIGENLDFGAVDIIKAAMETIQLNITREDLLGMFALEELLDTFGPNDIIEGFPACFVYTTEEAEQRFGLPLPTEVPTSPTGVRLPLMTGTFHISGLQSILKDFETMQALRTLVLPLAQDPENRPYIYRHKLMRSIEVRSGLQDEGIFVSEEEGMQIHQATMQSQQHMAELQLRAMEQQTQLAEQQGVLEGRKLELEGQKLQLDAQKSQADAQQAALESERKQAELAGTLATLEADLKQREADIAKTMAELARTDHEIQRSMLEAIMDLRKTEAQIAKIDAQMALAEKKAALQEQVARAQMQQNRQQQDRGQAHG